eukprot:3710213-Prymnesium_polylepis.1
MRGLPAYPGKTALRPFALARPCPCTVYTTEKYRHHAGFAPVCPRPAQSTAVSTVTTCIRTKFDTLEYSSEHAQIRPRTHAWPKLRSSSSMALRRPGLALRAAAAA